jgi:hypothetical protein
VRGHAGENADAGAHTDAEALGEPAPHEHLGHDRAGDGTDEQPQWRERDADEHAEHRARDRRAAAAGTPCGDRPGHVLERPRGKANDDEKGQPAGADGGEVGRDRVDDCARHDQRRTRHERQHRAGEAGDHEDADDDAERRHAVSRCTSGAGRGKASATVTAMALRASHGGA